MDDAVRFADGRPGMPEGTAARRAIVLNRQAHGAIAHVRQHIARIATELMVDGIGVKDMAQLAVATFAEVASNASGHEKSADRLTAAAHLARISGLYDATPPTDPAGESEEGLKKELIRRLGAIMKTVKTESPTITPDEAPKPRRKSAKEKGV